ncbi:hypothetical protein GCM10009600_33650 [Oerskovia paurometabola]
MPAVALVTCVGSGVAVVRGVVLVAAGVGRVVGRGHGRHVMTCVALVLGVAPVLGVARVRAVVARVLRVVATCVPAVTGAVTVLVVLTVLVVVHGIHCPVLPRIAPGDLGAQHTP